MIDIKRIMADARDGNLRFEDAKVILTRAIAELAGKFNLNMDMLSVNRVLSDPETAIIYTAGFVTAMAHTEREYISEDETKMVLNLFLELMKIGNDD